MIGHLLLLSAQLPIQITIRVAWFLSTRFAHRTPITQATQNYN